MVLETRSVDTHSGRERDRRLWAAFTISRIDRNGKHRRIPENVWTLVDTCRIL